MKSRPTSTVGAAAAAAVHGHGHLVGLLHAAALLVAAAAVYPDLAYGLREHWGTSCWGLWYMLHALAVAVAAVAVAAVAVAAAASDWAAMGVQVLTCCWLHAQAHTPYCFCWCCCYGLAAPRCILVYKFNIIIN